MRAAAVVAVLIVLGAAGAFPAAGQPNVILAMADDLGLADLGYNGNPWVRTPNLDRMARAGLRFDRFYSASPVCAPTRFSVLTGRHAYRSAIWKSNEGRLRDEELTIAEVLSDRGWSTAHFGKWHIGSAEGGGAGVDAGPRIRLSLPRHGFDVQFSTARRVPTWDPLFRPIAMRKELSWFPLTDPAQREELASPFVNERGEFVDENVHGNAARVIMDRAVPFIGEAVEGGTPFLAVVWFHAVHYPVVAGRPYTDLYAGRGEFDQCYFGTVTAMDEQIGRLRATLDSLGCADETMLWFCSDNGAMRPGSSAPFRGRKQTLWEGGVRVPSLLVWPERVDPGRSTSQPFVTSDYFPTILDLLDLESAATVTPLDGVSRRAVIDGDDTNERSSPIAFESHGMISLVDGRWKLLFTGVDDPALHLYNLAIDPMETHDVARDHPEIALSLARQLDTWRRSVHASAQGADYPDAEMQPRWRGVPLRISLAELAAQPER